MRFNTLFVLMIAGMAALSMSAPVHAWAIYDFGDNYFDEHNNTADIPAPGYPGQPNPLQPNPGTAGLGGERFDIEGLNFALENNKMYVSLTSSFGYGAYSSVWNVTYGAGDLFFGFDGSDRQYALRAQSNANDGGLYRVQSFLDIPNVPGGFANNAAIRNAVGPWRINQGENLGMDQFEATYTENLEPNPLIPANPSQTNGHTWVFEWCIDLSLFGPDFNIFDYSSINFSNTLGCGNDVLKETHQITNITPEPATMILFGTGLLGSGLLLRRRK